MNEIINKMTNKIYKYEVAPIVIYFALATFFAFGAVVLCSWYGRNPWSISFLWGMVQIKCG